MVVLINMKTQREELEAVGIVSWRYLILVPTDTERAGWSQVVGSMTMVKIASERDVLVQVFAYDTDESGPGFTLGFRRVTHPRVVEYPRHEIARGLGYLPEIEADRFILVDEASEEALMRHHLI